MSSALTKVTGLESWRFGLVMREPVTRMAVDSEVVSSAAASVGAVWAKAGVANMAPAMIVPASSDAFWKRCIVAGPLSVPGRDARDIRRVA